MHLSSTTTGIILNITLFSVIGFWPVFFLSAPRDRLLTSVALAPSMGFAITSATSTYLILLDYPVKTWAVGYCVLGVILALSILLYTWRRKRLTIEEVRSRKSDIVWLLCGLTIAIFMTVLPAVLGGDGFTVLRGNGADTFNYMTMAGYLDREPFSWKDRVPVVELLNKDRSYILAGTFLNTRWTTAAMLAFSARIAGLPIYLFEYSYTLLFFIIAFGPGYLISRCLKLNRLLAALVALVLGTGFWAQFVLDIRAFSQINSIPLILSIGYLLPKTACSGDAWDLKGGMLLGILGLGLVFCYVEIVPLCFLGTVIFLLLLYKGKKLRFTLVQSLFIALIVAAIGCIPQYSSLGQFFMAQLNSAASLSNDWHWYYFPWLYSSPFIGFWGLMPLTCPPCFQSSLLLGEFTEIVLLGWGGWLTLTVIVLVLQTLVHEGQSTMKISIVSFALAAVMEFLFLYAKGQLWAAGKALIFGYPFLVMLVGGVGLSPSTMSISNWLNWLSRFSVATWMFVQLCLGLIRTQVAITGLEFPNYVVHHGAYRAHNYDLSLFYNILTGHKEETLWLIVRDPWLAEYVNFALGPDHHVIDTFGVYTRANAVVGYQDLTDEPRYVLTDRNTLSYNKWSASFKMVAATNELALLEVQDPRFIFLSISNPNGIEEWHSKTGFWIGGGATVLNFIATSDSHVVFEADFIPGPSLPEQGLRRLEMIGDAVGGTRTFDLAEETREFILSVQRGNNHVILNVLDQPTLTALPNGDQRTLMLGVTNIHIRLMK